jgi:hypothetical protein
VDAAVEPSLKSPPKEAPKEARKSDVFLSSAQLQAERAKCSVSLKTAPELKVPAEGGRQTIKLSVSGGRTCVKAVAGSQDWVDVSSVSANSEITVTVQENDEAEGREADITIANTGTALTVHIKQAPNLAEFRALKL